MTRNTSSMAQSYKMMVAWFGEGGMRERRPKSTEKSWAWEQACNPDTRRLRQEKPKFKSSTKLLEKLSNLVKLHLQIKNFK